MNRIVLLVLLVGTSLRSGLAQPADTSRFFPLQPGNAWTYITVLDPPDAAPDTLWRGTYTVSEPFLVHDTLYYPAPNFFGLGDTLREDAAGRIWVRKLDRDFLLFDFTLPHGATYSVHYPASWGFQYQVTVSREQALDVAAGRFEGGIILRFDDSSIVDEERTFAFAPDIGLVYAYEDMGDYRELYHAEVDGRVVTAVAERPARPVLPVAEAYPNPFDTSLRIMLPDVAGQRPRITIYDILGREVAVLRTGACRNSPCVVEWESGGLPDGVYFIRLEGGERLRTIKVVRRR